VRGLAIALLIAALAAVAGCGDDAPGSPQSATTARAVPPLARRAVGPGEVLVRGDLSPKLSGPYDFDGRYVVRFEQYAPEDPRLDFSGQTPFTAALEERPEGREGRSVKLFEAASRTGRRTIRVTGRLYVDVSFGDFPFVMRFTPVHAAP
jgi:hypothetical protein